jgi:hypothetical protein
MRLALLESILLGFMICLCSCKQRKNAVVVLDDQWSVGQAIVDCQSRATQGAPACTSDPSADIRNFEAQFSQAFKAEPMCSELTLVTLNASHDRGTLRSRRTWWLFLELSRGLGADEKRFTVSRTNDPYPRYSHRMTGQGRADFTAKSVCDFVRNGEPMP